MSLKNICVFLSIISIGAMQEINRVYSCNGPPFKEDQSGITCHGALHRYSYVLKNDTCVHWIYGGCFGNGNNFKTRVHCEALCVKDKGKNTIIEYHASEEDLE